MTQTKRILVSFLALVACALPLHAQQAAPHEVSVSFQGLGLGSMPFSGSVSWNDQPGVSLGFSAGYTYWLNERVGLRTGLRWSSMSHNHQISNLSMPFSLPLKMSSLGYTTGTGVTTVNMQSHATSVQEEQHYTFIELPLQAALRWNKIYLNLGISLAQALTANSDYSYKDPSCDIVALPEMGITMTTPVPLKLEGATEGHVKNSDMAKPFYFLLDAEAGYKFYLNDVTSIGVGLFGRLAPIAHQPKSETDAFLIQPDATYKLVQPSTSMQVERIGYYEIGLSVGVNFGLGARKDKDNESDQLMVPMSGSADNAYAEQMKSELAAMKSAREQAQGELAALEAARKKAESDLDTYRKSLADLENQQNAKKNEPKLEAAPKNKKDKGLKQETVPMRTQTANTSSSEENGDMIQINFDYNKTKPLYDDATEAKLRSLCAEMQADPNKRALVIGHTDNVGSMRNNNKMGRMRAAKVKKLMVDLGAPAESIDITTRGEKEPIESNKTQDGRAKNRRVTVQVQ